MDESQGSAAAGGPPVNSIEVQNGPSGDQKMSGQTTQTPTVTTAGSSLPPLPYRSAGGLASEMGNSSNHNVAAAGGGGASVSTISPGSLAGNQNNPTPSSNAVQFSARDASVLQTPNLNSTNLNPNLNLKILSYPHLIWGAILFQAIPGIPIRSS